MMHFQDSVRMASDFWEECAMGGPLDTQLDLWSLEQGDNNWTEDVIQQSNGDVLDLLSIKLSANTPEQCLPEAVTPEIDVVDRSWFDTRTTDSTLKDIGTTDIESMLDSISSVYGVNDKSSIIDFNDLTLLQVSGEPEENRTGQLSSNEVMELDETSVDILDLLGITAESVQSKNSEDDNSVLRRLLTSEVISFENPGPQSVDTGEKPELNFFTSLSSPESLHSSESSDDEYVPPEKTRKSVQGHNRQRRTKLRRIDRRTRKKEQNKNAAIRYREKKKVEQQTMETECMRLERINRQLKEKVEDMRRESTYLKNLIIEIYRKPVEL